MSLQGYLNTAAAFSPFKHACAPFPASYFKMNTLLEIMFDTHPEQEVLL